MTVTMAEPNSKELTPRALRLAMGLGAGEHFVVRGRLPVLPWVAASANAFLRAREEDQREPSSLILLPYLAYFDYCLFVMVGPVALYAGLAGLAGWGLYHLARVVHLPAELTVSTEGIEVRRGRRRELVAWSDVDAVQQDGTTGLIATRRRVVLFDLAAAGADRLYNAASRVISAREHGEVVRLADWTPDTALSLASDESLGGAEERGISLARDEEG